MRGTRGVAHDRLAHADEEPGCADGRIATPRHRRRARMPGVTFEREPKRARARNARDDPDIDAVPLEQRALLDVELEVGRKRRRVAARIRQPLLDEPHPREPREQRLPAAARGGENLRRQRAGQRPASEQPDERALLVREVDRLEGDGQLETGVANHPQHLERRKHAERAVVTAAVRHRVQM